MEDLTRSPEQKSSEVATRVAQNVALRLQLAMIAGNEPRSSFIEIRPLKPAGEQVWIHVRAVSALIATISKLAPRHDVYIGVCPRIQQGGTKEDVERAWCLWADCDTADAVERLRAFRPPPSMIIRSGSLDGAEPKLHAYWQLSTPIPAPNIRRANRRIACALDCDRGAVTNRAAILRPAGSLNHKSTPPAAVTCIYAEPVSYHPAAVVGELEDHPAEIPLRPRLRAIQGGSGSISGLVEMVLNAAEGNRNEALNWAAWRAGQDPRVDVEQAHEELLEAAAEAGLTEREARATIASGLGASS